MSDSAEARTIMGYEPIHVVDLEPPLRLSKAGRAGRWFSAQGVTASDYQGELVAGATVPAGVELYETSVRAGRETFAIYDQLKGWLSDTGSSLDDLVRVDQYYPNVEAVSAYQAARRGMFQGHVPPSTSIVMERMLSPQCSVHLDALGLLEDEARTPIPDPEAPVREASGFAPALQAGEFVFLAGQLPNHPKEGIHPDARRHPEHPWGFHDMKLQTSFILKNMFRLTEAAGVSAHHVLKAQIYVRHVEDLPYFNAQWREAFGDEGPVCTVVPGKGYGLSTGDIEINMLGVRDGVEVERREPLDDRPSLPGEPSSIRAEDLVLLPGITAAQADGVPDAVSRAAREPFLRSRARAQTMVIIDRVEEELARHGLGLEHLLRIVQFHTDLGEFRPAAEVWAERMDGRPVPLSAVEVHDRLPARDATIVAECWAVADQT